jgi:hypothetical protein
MKDPQRLGLGGLDAACRHHEGGDDPGEMFPHYHFLTSA